MNNHSNPSPGKSEFSKHYGFILHLWNGRGYWRASLENLETGKRLGFESLEKLFIHLMDLAEGNFQEKSAENEQRNEIHTGNTGCGCLSENSIKTQ